MAQPVFSFDYSRAPSESSALAHFRVRTPEPAPLAEAALPAEPGQREGYVLTKSAPDVAPAEVELLGVDSIEVIVTWGENVLHVAHLTPPRDFSVGEGEGSDFLVPYEKIGCAKLPLVRVAGVPRLLVPAGAAGHVDVPGRERLLLDGAGELTATGGMRAEIRLGDLAFRIAVVNAGKPSERGLGAAWDRTAAAYFSGAFFVHAALMAGLAAFVPPLGLSDDEALDQDRLYAMQQYLDAAAEREREKEERQVEQGPSEREGGTGERAQGAEGQMGKTTSRETNRRYAIRGPKNNPDPHQAREAALREAADYGLIGLLKSGVAGDPNAPTAPWGRDTSLGTDDVSAMGNMWGDEIGDAFGAGGLGITGIGEGGGGPGLGIGVGDIGGLGHGAGLGTRDGFGNGVGRLGDTYKPKPRSGVRLGNTTVSGRLPKEIIQRIVRQNYGRFRMCYEQGLTRNPNLEGRVEARFVINRDGAVSNVSNGASDLPDAAVKSCVLSAFYGLSFPAPEGGIVTVAYPILLTPG